MAVIQIILMFNDLFHQILLMSGIGVLTRIIPIITGEIILLPILGEIVINIHDFKVIVEIGIQTFRDVKIHHSQVCMAGGHISMLIPKQILVIIRGKPSHQIQKTYQAELVDTAEPVPRKSKYQKISETKF